MKKRPMFPWMRMRKKTDQELPYEPPILLGNKSNGEFFYDETPRDRRIRAEILKRCDDKARRLGMDRREFVASSMGMVTSLSVLNMAAGCGDDDGVTMKDSGVGDAGARPDGGYTVTRDAMVDCAMADAIVGGKEFIVDMQTHFIEDEEVWKEHHPADRMYRGEGFADSFTFYSCSPRGPQCIGPEAYEEQILLGSDTTVAVLSGFPSSICEDATLCGNLNSNEDMVRNRERFNGAAGNSQRVIQHCQVAPNDNWPKQAEMMRRISERYGNWGWKVYPPWGPGDAGGWWLDDPAVADPFIELALELADPAFGGPIICAHKGFPLGNFDPVTADPKDVGPAADKWAGDGVKFVVYHSAIELGAEDLEYSPDKYESVNRMIETVIDHDLYGKNVYAETGSAWALLMHRPEPAAHYFGKLLKHLGEDNIVWGSECTWFGSPQPQIEAFRAFTIPEDMREQYGYPELTDTAKAKILGLNAAKLYNLDVDAMRCELDSSKLAQTKRDLDGELGGRRWAFQKPFGPTTRREFVTLQRWKRFTGHVG